MVDTITNLLINTGVAAIILIAGFWVAGRLKSWLKRFIVSKNIDPMLASFLSSIAHMLLLAFVIIAALSKLGVQTTSLVAIIGAAGLAVGLSLQSSLSNFASGVMIIAFHPFKVGDFVEAGGVSGVVEGMQIFATRMRTGDNKQIIVPNSKITGSTITNYSAKDTRRIDMVFSIGYEDDLKKARQVLQELVNNDDRVLDDPETVIAVSELGDSSVNFIVRPWVKSDDYWKVYWDFTEAVKLRFDQEGISIPYPQRDLHLHQVAA